MRRVFVLLAFIGLWAILLTAGCNEMASPLGGVRATPSATLLPQYVRTAQAAEAAAQATISAGRAIQVQTGLTATAVSLSMTQAAATQAALATATAQALSATATAQAAATRQAQERATATMQAMVLAGTATAQSLNATATMQAMNVAATATAQHLNAVATEQAAAYAVRATATQAAIQAQATALAAAAEARQLEIEQQRLLNEAWAIARFLLVIGGAILVLGLGTWMVVQWQKYRVVRVAANKVLLRLGDGWYDPDRNPYPIASLGPDGRPSLPKTPPDDMQERTTARAQYVELARASEGKRLPRRSGPIAPPPPANGGARFRVLKEAGKALPGVVTPETAQVLEAEWREAHEEGG